MFTALSEQLLSNLLFLIYLHTVKTLVWTFIFLSLDYCNIPFTGSSKYKSISLLLRILLQTPFLVHAQSQVYLYEFFLLSSVAPPYLSLNIIIYHLFCTSGSFLANPHLIPPLFIIETRFHSGSARRAAASREILKALCASSY